MLCDDHLVVLGLETQRLDLVLRRTRERESGRARVSGQGVERVPPGALLAHVGRLEQLAHKFAGLGAQLEHNRGVVDGPLVFHVLVLDHDACARGTTRDRRRAQSRPLAQERRRDAPSLFMIEYAEKPLFFLSSRTTSSTSSTFALACGRRSSQRSPTSARRGADAPPSLCNRVQRPQSRGRKHTPSSGPPCRWGAHGFLNPPKLAIRTGGPP